MEHVAGVLWEGGAWNIIVSTCLKGLAESVCKQKDCGLGSALNRYKPDPPSRPVVTKQEADERALEDVQKALRSSKVCTAEHSHKKEKAVSC